MTRRRSVTRTLAIVFVIALVAVACREDDPAPAAPDDDPDAIATDIGVTSDPCPDAVNEDNGCIYLGILSDLTQGPFAAFGSAFTPTQEAFWQRVNEDGGIGGFDVDVSSNIQDNEYDPDVHNRRFQEIRDDVLAIAQTLGSPTTAAIQDDMEADNMVAIPGSFTSGWDFNEYIIESGANYCVESMNAIDWYVDNEGVPDTIMTVHYPGDYGDDASQGARIAAEEHGAEFNPVETVTGPENQGAAIESIVSEDPDVVVITTGPVDMAEVVGEATARGYEGQFFGTGPTWEPGLLDTAAIDAIIDQYKVTLPFPPWDADFPGNDAMKEAIGDVDPSDLYGWGWAWQYPLLAGLEQAAENGDLTREGLHQAMGEITDVDYEGFLPEGSPAGVYDDPNDAVVREVILAEIDPDAPSGVAVVEDFFAGPTVSDYVFEEPCHLLVD